MRQFIKFDFKGTFKFYAFIIYLSTYILICIFTYSR